MHLTLISFGFRYLTPPCNDLSMSMVIDLRNLPRPWENIDAKTLRGTDSMFVKQLFSYPSVIQFWNRLVEKVRSFIETVLDVQRKLGAKAAPSKQKPDNHKNSLRGSNASGHTTRVKKIRNIIAIGCRSGHHRSVAFVERLAIYLQQSINHKSTNNNGMMITNTNNNTGIPASASGGCGNSTSVSQLPRSLCHTSSLSTAKSGCNEWELLPAKNTAPRLPLGNIDIKIEHRDIDRDPTQELHLRKGLQPFALTCKPCQVHTSSTVSWNLHIM